jgi:DNA-binding transcriptional MerR regulator
MYKIGELSKLCRLPVKTLRYYDSEGLLKPDVIDRFTGYRYYSASKLADVNKIIVLKELGFSLEQIKAHLNAKSEPDLTALIEAKEAELTQLKLKTEMQLKRLSDIKENILKGEIRMFDIIIRSADALCIACVRDIFAEKSKAYKRAELITAELPKNIAGKRKVIINYETEYVERNFDLEAGVEITGKLPKEFKDKYMEKEIAFTTDVASLVCNISELEEAYQAMIRQLETAPCQIIGAFYEIYHDDGTVELKVPVCKLSQNADKHKNDDINLPFENDVDVIGKWEFLDAIPSEEQFSFKKEKSSHSVWLNELYFLPEGEGFWAVDGWTKGWLFTSSGFPEVVYKNRYYIKELDGQKLLFLEMKDYQYESKGGMPIVWVYKKVSDKTYSRNEIRICDNTDLPFVPDDKVLGKWIARDFVLEEDNFYPEKQNFPKENLFFVSAYFTPDGTVTCTFEPPQDRQYTINWTKGVLLDKINQTASGYKIKTIGGTEYLFIEWKSGDYTFGGRKPYYYVFTRA